jgi:Domain of unknown function (DUF4915)
VSLLQLLDASLLVTTYQANKLLVARAAADGLSLLVRTFERPMGLAVDAQWLTVGTRNQIWFLCNAPDIAASVEPAGRYRVRWWLCAKFQWSAGGLESLRHVEVSRTSSPV